MHISGLREDLDFTLSNPHPLYLTWDSLGKEHHRIVGMFPLDENNLEQNF